MPEITIKLASGRQIGFPVDGQGTAPPCFLLGVRKCGSSILNNICNSIATLNGRGYVDVGHAFFTGNVLATEWQADPALRAIIRPGNIYGGFREMPLGLESDPAFIAAPKLLMVRDPRDALVSEYFSNAYSHSIPEKAADANGVTELLTEQRKRALAETVQAYVTSRAAMMNDTMMLYRTTATMPNTAVVKYEDMILDKPTLIARLCTQFSLSVTPGDVANILKWADKLPSVEDPKAFVRRVRPGDHREKLDSATIAALNRALRPAMQLFRYAI